MRKNTKYSNSIRTASWRILACALSLFLVCSVCPVYGQQMRMQQMCTQELVELTPQRARDLAEGVLTRKDTNILVIEVQQLHSMPWTIGNSPEATVVVQEALTGTISGSHYAKWKPFYYPGCGNDKTTKESRDRWLKTPVTGPASGQKLIVIAALNKMNELEIHTTWFYSPDHRNAFANAIATLTRKKRKSSNNTLSS